jgi:enediyne biosynthesis protein E4
MHLDARVWAVVAGLGVCGSAGADVVKFTDVTASAGISMSHGPFAPGVPGFNEWTMSGACVGDFNNDGWPDIFVLKGGNGTDKLFINNGNGTFSDQTVAWGIAAPQHCGNGVAVGDFDRDGFADMYVSSYGKQSGNVGEIGKHKLFRNTGFGTFQDVAVAAGVNMTSSTASVADGVAWGDYDLDGDLDLFAAAWSQTAQGNRLFRNNGDGTFTNVTGTAIQIPSVTWGFQPTFADLDGDRYPEIILAADFATTRLYRNNRNGTFTEISATSGFGVPIFGMGLCVADFDRDGDLDSYVTSIYESRSPNPAYLNGNAFLRNNGDLNFVEVASTTGVDDGGWGWGVVAADFDHDGWIDMIEANGRNSAEWANELEYYYRNNGDGTFTRDDEISAQFLNADARTIITLDYDRDGDMDVAIYYNLGPLKLYRNDTEAGPGKSRHWLQVELKHGSNPFIAPFGYGTRLVARAGDTEFVRYMDGGNGYLGSSELIAHFGLGNASVIDELRIEWARGYVTTLTDIEANRRLTITAPALGDLNADGLVSEADVEVLFAGWGTVTLASLHCDLNNDGTIDRRDLAIMLGYWNE